MNPFKVLITPEYLFQPKQMWSRLKRSTMDPLPASADVNLPWGDCISVRPSEMIGFGIWWYGIFDLIVAETISRLVDKGETALDIGANIGQMTSLLRSKLGTGGRVLAFEPHPQLFAELTKFIERNQRPNTAKVDLYQAALSDSSGEGHLELPKHWESNRGLGKITNVEPSSDGLRIKVPTMTLDSLLPSPTQVGLCKIDVEGHELQVFKGAISLLGERRIRDIVFEDFSPRPSALQDFLRSMGYHLFVLRISLFKPKLAKITSIPPLFIAGAETNFLATLDPIRARKRFAKWGWRALKHN